MLYGYLLTIICSSREIRSSNYNSISSSNISYSDENGQCEEGNEESEQPTTTPDEPTTTPDQPTTINDTTSTSDPSHKAKDNFYEGNLKFTSKFFNIAVDSNPGKSVTMSPFSAIFLIAELARYAEKEAAEQILNAFNFNDLNEIQTAIPSILDSIDEQKNVSLTLVARVYGNINDKFSNTFKAESKKILRAEPENIDFSDGQKAADTINKWVADNTNNKVTDLVPASLLTPDTKLVLTNAFYFLGEWVNKFNPETTTSKDFYTSDGSTVKVNTMYQVEYFNYAEIEKLNAQALELPYVNNNLTCLIILPKDKDGATSLVSKLVEENALKSVRSSLQFTNVAVSLPKFITTTTTDLKDVCQKSNITMIFDSEKSSLKNILDDPLIRLYISAGIQKANIEINEVGSEAAAGNAAVGKASGGMPPPPKIFNANRSFIYYLMFKETPIFCGLYAGN